MPRNCRPEIRIKILLLYEKKLGNLYVTIAMSVNYKRLMLPKLQLYPYKYIYIYVYIHTVQDKFLNINEITMGTKNIFSYYFIVR